jgi:hypothetical protein
VLFGRNTMKLIPAILASVILISGVLAGCSQGLQTFSKYDMSFQLSSRFKLEEYTVGTQTQQFQKGTASVEEGALISTDHNFLLSWVKGNEPNAQELKFYIQTTPSFFTSTSSSFKARVTGNQTTEKIGDFDITAAGLQLSTSGAQATGVTAVWYCPTSGRIMHIIIIDKQADIELRSFIQSFSCG